MNFTFYDIGFLVLFVVATSIFLFLKRKNLQKEGLMFLYRTNVGVKLIEKFGKKHEKLLNFLSYVSVILGFLLMIGGIYLFGKIIWTYVFRVDVVQAIKVPPIMPLIPYLPQVFEINFLPPFYFSYWIVILAIVAITHEFSHGIFAINKNVKVKKTGFGFFPFFLPVFLAAFVELDEEVMEKKKVFPQMAILSAGTFANVLTFILFSGILVLFFSLSFAPAGVVFDVYTYTPVGFDSIISVNGVALDNPTYEGILEIVDNEFSEIQTTQGTYFADSTILEDQTLTEDYILLYEDFPAAEKQISKTILKVNGVETKSRDELSAEILKYSPGEEVTLTCLDDEEIKNYEIILGENPDDATLPYLGIGFYSEEKSGIMGSVMNIISMVREPHTYYAAKFGAAEFFYNLLWWLVIISFSVALVNMLPVGIFDGGRFFYLMIFAITKSKTKAKKVFSFMTYFFLALLLVVMFFWVKGMFF